MKTYLWISILLPLAVFAEDIDYFNEATEPVAPSVEAVPAPAAPPSKPPPKAETKKSWGQGALEYFEKLAAPLRNQPSSPSSTAPAVNVSTAIANPADGAYIQKQIKAKLQEILKIRQEILQTKDGQKLQTLTGTLHRLEAEYQQLLEASKQSTPLVAGSPMAVPTPPVEKIAIQQTSTFPTQPLPIQYANEEDALKAQLDILIQQEKELTQKINATPDANTLSMLASQLERIQQNKNLVMLSLQDVQRRALKHSKVGFGTTLLPPVNQNISMPVPSLTPSIQQVIPTTSVPNSTPWPTGWGGFSGTPPAPKENMQQSKPIGTPLTSEGWKKIQSQAESTFEEKDVHTNYKAPPRPLWTPKDHLGPVQRKSVSHEPIDHRQLVEKIRKEKIFSHPAH